MLLNLTPHVINIICASSNVINIPPSGQIARCTSREAKVGEMVLEDGCIEITRTVLGEVEGLPEEKEGVFLIVSRLVADGSRGRRDLLIPGPLVRDEKGVVVGCRGLGKL